MAFRVVGPEKTILSAMGLGGHTTDAPAEFVVPGESVQIWGGGSLVVADSQNRVTAIFASGEWSRAIREDER